MWFGVYIGSDNRAPTVVVLLSHHHALLHRGAEPAKWGPRDILHQLTFVLAVSNTIAISGPIAEDSRCWGWGEGGSLPGQPAALALRKAYHSSFAKEFCTRW